MIDAVAFRGDVSCIHDDIVAMPMQYEPLVGDMRSTLSGGQKQPVCIARAIYRKPALLVLDEGTASIDPMMEHALMKSLIELNIVILICSPPSFGNNLRNAHHGALRREIAGDRPTGHFERTS